MSLHANSTPKPYIQFFLDTRANSDEMANNLTSLDGQQFSQSEGGGLLETGSCEIRIVPVQQIVSLR